MIQRLILHVGAHRTGSSALQNFLHENQEVLLEYGVLYPSSGRGGGNPENHHILVLALRSGNPDPGEALREELARANSHTAVLSSEMFNETNIVAEIAQLLTGLPREVVLFARRQDLRVESSYRQMVKDSKSRHSDPPGKHFTAIAYNDGINYQAVLDRYAELGPTAFHLIPYDEPRDRTTVYRQFLDILSVPWTDQLGLPSARLENRSLHTDCLEFKRLTNASYLSLEDDLALARALNAVSLELGVDQHRYLLPPAYRARILSWYDESNRRLAEERFGRSELFASAIDVEDEWQPYRGLEGDTVSRIRAAIQSHGALNPTVIAAVDAVDAGQSRRDWSAWADEIARRSN